MRLFGKKSTPPLQPETIELIPTQLNVVPWDVPPWSETYKVPSEHEATVYTYNGTPLQNLKSGARFIITAVPADVTMTSIYTGTTASTTDYGDIAYQYNGQIIGFCKSHAEAVRKLLCSGYRVDVEAYISS